RGRRQPCADSEPPTVAGLLQSLVVQHFHLEAGGFAQSLCTLGEFGRKQVTRRGVHQVAGGGDRGRDGRAVRAVFLGVFRGGERGDLAQPVVFRRGLNASEGGEPVAA